MRTLIWIRLLVSPKKLFSNINSCWLRRESRASRSNQHGLIAATRTALSETYWLLAPTNLGCAMGSRPQVGSFWGEWVRMKSIHRSQLVREKDEGSTQRIGTVRGISSSPGGSVSLSVYLRVICFLLFHRPL